MSGSRKVENFSTFQVTALFVKKGTELKVKLTLSSVKTFTHNASAWGKFCPKHFCIIDKSSIHAGLRNFDKKCYKHGSGATLQYTLTGQNALKCSVLKFKTRIGRIYLSVNFFFAQSILEAFGSHSIFPRISSAISKPLFSERAG